MIVKEFYLMGQFFLVVAPVILEKVMDWGHDLVISHGQQVCAAKCAAASKAGFAAGVKLGLLYGVGGVLLLIVVVGAVIFVIKYMQEPPEQQMPEPPEQGYAF